MIPVFRWKVERQVTEEVRFRVVEVQYGDGYKQVVGDGINNKDQSYSVRIHAYESEAREIKKFFDDLGGYKSFYWTPPLGEMGLFRCLDPKPTPQGGGLYVFSCTFEKVYASPVE